jgi:signal transduction histidine kinase
VRFAGRLVAGTVLVLVVTMVVLVLAADRALRADLEADLRTALEREARLVRDALPENPAQWQELVTRLARASEHRITLIDSAGRVVAESQPPAGGIRMMPSHADRPEVQAVLAGAAATSRRQSATTGQLLFYAAVPGGPGVIRIASDLTAVDGVVRTAQRSVFGAALLALVVGIILAILAGRSIASPLNHIATAAHAIAGGIPPRFPRSGIPDVDSLVQALREMHQQLGARFDALRLEQAGSAALVDAMAEGVLAADGRGRIVRANPAARRLLGYAEQDALPDLPQLFRAKAAREAVDAVLAGRLVQDREVELDDLTLLVSARPLPAGGAVVVLHDQTEVRRLETIRRDFVANVSHELKTPLTSISGYAETLLHDSPDPDTTRRFLETILANAQRMQHLVDDQLDLSRIESGHWLARPEWLEATTLVQEAWAACASRATEKQVEFRLQLGPGADRIPADPDGIRQVLVNLFDNAVRYTPTGGTITCRTSTEDGTVTIAVQDTGSGIPREHLPRVFERFYRVDPSRSRDEGGTGLGLAIVKHIVEGHGGTVTAESALQLGTTMTLRLPRIPGGPADATAQGAPA